MVLLHNLPIILASTLLEFNRHLENKKSLFFPLKYFIAKKNVNILLCAYLFDSWRVCHPSFMLLSFYKGGTVRISNTKGNW